MRFRSWLERLGTNSLLDINVFGRRAGIAAAEHASKTELAELPDDAAGFVVSFVENLRDSTGNERVSGLRKAMQRRWT